MVVVMFLWPTDRPSCQIPFKSKFSKKNTYASSFRVVKYRLNLNSQRKNTYASSFRFDPSPAGGNDDRSVRVLSQSQYYWQQSRCVLHLLMLMNALVFVFEIICLSESLVMPDDVHMMMMSSHALLLLTSWMIFGCWQAWQSWCEWQWPLQAWHSWCEWQWPLQFPCSIRK